MLETLKEVYWHVFHLRTLQIGQLFDPLRRLEAKIESKIVISKPNPNASPNQSRIHHNASATLLILCLFTPARLLEFSSF